MRSSNGPGEALGHYSRHRFAGVRREHANVESAQAAANAHRQPAQHAFDVRAELGGHLVQLLFRAFPLRLALLTVICAGFLPVLLIVMLMSSGSGPG